jgi:hypothetical protein
LPIGTVRRGPSSRPHPSDHAILTDLDAGGPDDIWAVGWGSEEDSTGSVPAIEHFDGSVWSFVELPAGPNPEIISLAVTAVAPDDVWVAGWMGRAEIEEGTQ